MRSAPWLLVVLGLAAFGCAGDKGNRAAGDACLRTSQCADGLACVEGVCSTDLSSVVGMTPGLPDAGVRDAARVPDASADANTDAL